MNITVDIGNTQIKLGIFNADVLVDELVFNDVENLKSYLKNNFINNSLIISSVSGYSKSFFSISRKFNRSIFLNYLTELPIKNLYKTPKTIGVDRLAAAVGVWSKYPNIDVLIIDAGTAITIDYINKYAEYIGGNISPGIGMRASALSSHTKKLPLVKTNDVVSFIGTNTFEAINNGIVQGVKFEIQMYIENFFKKYSNGKVVITGGDLKYFADMIKKTIFAEKNIVLKGLNHILNYNANKI